ncbi:unnamed protein product [Amoebophrya sp. A120]|nr:unnamed protein product [Amoebophrya sp. A120]|eukprot:GSA120T00025380001.1
MRLFPHSLRSFLIVSTKLVLVHKVSAKELVDLRAPVRKESPPAQVEKELAKGKLQKPPKAADRQDHKGEKAAAQDSVREAHRAEALSPSTKSDTGQQDALETKGKGPPLHAPQAHHDLDQHQSRLRGDGRAHQDDDRYVQHVIVEGSESRDEQIAHDDISVPGQRSEENFRGRPGHDGGVGSVAPGRHGLGDRDDGLPVLHGHAGEASSPQREGAPHPSQNRYHAVAPRTATGFPLLLDELDWKVCVYGVEEHCPEVTCDAPTTVNPAAWRSVTLPHDYLVESPAKDYPAADVSHGFRPFRKAWYKLHLDLGAVEKNLNPGGRAAAKEQDELGENAARRKKPDVYDYHLEFQGVSWTSSVWVNGSSQVRHWSAYTPFRVPLTLPDTAANGIHGSGSSSSADSKFEITIAVDSTPSFAHKNDVGEGSWWYDGGGIYRHVLLHRSSRTKPRVVDVYLPHKVVTERIDQHKLPLRADVALDPVIEVSLGERDTDVISGRPLKWKYADALTASEDDAVGSMPEHAGPTGRTTTTGAAASGNTAIPTWAETVEGPALQKGAAEDEKAPLSADAAMNAGWNAAAVWSAAASATSRASGPDPRVTTETNPGKGVTNENTRPATPASQQEAEAAARSNIAYMTDPRETNEATTLKSAAGRRNAPHPTAISEWPQAVIGEAWNTVTPEAAASRSNARETNKAIQLKGATAENAPPATAISDRSETATSTARNTAGSDAARNAAGSGSPVSPAGYDITPSSARGKDATIGGAPLSKATSGPPKAAADGADSAAERATSVDRRVRARVSVYRYKPGADKPARPLVATMISEPCHRKGDGSTRLKCRGRAPIVLQNVELWDGVRNPALYLVELRLLDDRGEFVDDPDAASSTIRVGFRRFAWDAGTGFYLNDRPMKIKGFANHQDFAGVGVALSDDVQEYRVWAMKNLLNANAWRTAHNSATPALLDACDELGLLVWAENHRNKLSPDSYKQDLVDMVKLNRNRASVFMWSVCNERLCCPERSPCDFGDKAVVDTARDIIALIRKLDPGFGASRTGAGTASLSERRISSACNTNDLENARPFLELMDVIGINYHLHTYDTVRKLFPRHPLIVSEASSDYSTRGEYSTDQKKQYVSSFDTEYPPWGNTAEDSWCAVKEKPFVSGQFYWTGFDYRGEPTPFYKFPSLTSHFGNLDLAGFPKDNAMYHRALLAEPFSESGDKLVHLVAADWWHKTASGTANNTTASFPVWVYASESAGKDGVNLIGKYAKSTKNFGTKNLSEPCRHAEWTLMAEDLQGLTALTAASVRYPNITASIAKPGPAARLQLDVDWPIARRRPSSPTASRRLLPHGLAGPITKSTFLVRVAAYDDAGILVRDESALKVDFALHFAHKIATSSKLPARIVGLGSGNPTSLEQEKPLNATHGSRILFHGLARIVLDVQESGELADGAPGQPSVLVATAPGLESASLALVTPTIPASRTRAHAHLRDEPVQEKLGHSMSTSDADAQDEEALSIYA